MVEPRPEPFRTELIGGDDRWSERFALILFAVVVLLTFALIAGMLAGIGLLIAEAIS